MGIFKRIKDRKPYRDIDSKTTNPIVLEKLEQRILLSGDGLLNIAPNPLDPLLDNTSQVIQYAELLDTDAQAEEQVSQELTSSDTLNSEVYKPILTLSQDDTNGESDDPELGVNIVSPAQLDSEPDLQLAGSDVDIALALGVDLLEENGVQPIGENVDSECFESCQRQLIIEQLTDTLRVPHGPPGAEGILTSLDNVQLEYLLSGEQTAPASNAVIPLDEADLTSILDEAICRWTATGLVFDAGVFADVSLVIADLPNGVLGQAEADVISIDVTADGHGWFVDLTPADDSEFVLGNDGRLIAREDGPATGRMDLLTVVLHELGHVAGFGHTDVLTNDGPDVMRYFINSGVRLLANATADQLEPGFTLDVPAFLLTDPKLNDVIDNVLTIYFNPISEYPDSYEFTSGDIIDEYEIPEFINIGDTIGGGYADLELQDVILTFSGLAFEGGSWTGWVKVEATSAILFPGLLNIEVVDDDVADPSDPEGDNDSDLFAVVGVINLAEGNSESELNLDNIDVVKIGWPGFLSVTITELKLKFENFRGDEDHIENTLSLKVELAGFGLDISVVELSISGSASVELKIEEIEDALDGGIGNLADAMEAALATAMATKLTGLEGSISGTLFKVGSLSADFTYETVTYDPGGPDEQSVVYLAIRGSLSIGAAIAGDDDGGDGGGGFGGFGFAFAISELGPLHFFAYVDYPITLEPYSGLAISSMGLGVMFNTTIEDLQTDTDFTIGESDVAIDGTTVTLTISEHDFEVGDELKIRNAGNDEYDGNFTVVSTTESTITYDVASDPEPFWGSAEIIRLTIKDPLDLMDSGIQKGPDTPEDLDDWKYQLEGRVLKQIGDGGEVGDVKAAWDRLFGEVVLGGQASLSFDPRIPDMLLSFDVTFLLGIGLGFDTKPLLQIFLNGKMSLLGGMVSLANTRLYADLSDLFSGEGKFLYLQTQGEIDIPGVEIEPLLVYRGWISFETFVDVVGTDVLGASVIDDTASGYWTVELDLALDPDHTSSDYYDVGDSFIIFDSDPYSFDGRYEVFEVSDVDTTITFRVYCDLNEDGDCTKDEIDATDPGTWVSGSSSAKVSNDDDLGGGFQISLGGGVDLNIPGINADLEPITVTTLTLETIGDDVTVSFIVPPDSAEEEFRIELSFYVALSETHVGNIATAEGKFVVALDFDADEFIVIYGAAELTTKLEFLENIGLYMNLEAFLRINSSNQDRSIELPGGLEVDLPANSFLIRFEGSVDFRIDFNGNHVFEDPSESVFEIEGIFILEFSPGGFNAAVYRETAGGNMPATLRLGPKGSPFLEFNVFAFIAIRSDGFAANLVLTLNVSAPGPLSGLISLDARFVFIMNTTGEEVTFDLPGGAYDPNRPPGVSSLIIPDAGPADPGALADASLNDLINGNPWTEMATVGPYGVLFFDGNLTLLYVITLSASGYVSLTPDLMEMRVEVSGSFLKMIEVSGSAMINSNGEFEFIVDGNVQFGISGFNIGGSAHLEVSYLYNNGTASGGTDPKILNVEGWVTGGGEIFWIGFTIFKLGVSYNSITGDIKLKVGPVPVPGIDWVCFWGICIPYPTIELKFYSFTIGTLKVVAQPPLPVVLGQVDAGGELTLNVGPDAADRNLMVDEPDEGVLIERVSAGSEKGEKIRITMFGHSQVFDNVLNILIRDMAAGDDYVEIYAGVTVPVEVHFGDDDDTLISAGSGVVTAYGDGGADSLTGGSAGDLLFGGLGNDFINGKAGQDQIEGGDGPDLLIGGEDDDIINGGAGNDRIVGDLVDITGDETTSIFETIASASGGNDIIDGGDGDDVILGGSGNDVINGGAGEDLLIGDDGTVIVSVVDEDISISFTLTDFDFSGNDIIDGGADNDTLFGQKGEDILIGGIGDDHLYGDADAFGTETAGNILLGDDGTIMVNGIVTVDTTGETAGGADTIWGNGGADIVMGGAAVDMIYGDAGDDILLGDTGMVVLDNGSLVYVNTEDEEFGGSDTIHGDTGNDIIIGGLNSSCDTLYGDAGDDIILGDNGLLDFAYNGDIDLTTLDLIRSATDGFGGGDYIYGNAGSDVILGGTGGDEIQGNDDPDILIGDNADIFLSGFVPGELTILGSAVNEIISTDTGESTGGADTITGNEASDIIIGGVNGSSDMLYGNDGDDVILGDNGLLDFAYNGDTNLTTLVLIRSATDGLGGSDVIYGNAGDDVLIGGTGGDSIDGNEGKDLILGDNGELTYMNGDTSNPRFRVLEGAVIYDETPGVDDGLPLIDWDSQFNDPAGIPQWANWEVTLSVNSGGADYIAGGPDNDQIFGQGGNDIIQGDGTIGTVDALTAVDAYRDDDGLLVVSASVEGSTDGDDYIEGNGGNDIIFGNLGQDDIIGGSSELFGLDTAAKRTDGEDMIFGDAGTELLRNETENIPDEGDTSHGRDSDMILGDNGNIYRLVSTNGADSSSYLEFKYDNYGTEKIIVRVAELVDYTPGGVDYDAVNAAYDIGAPDEIHGESGDDFLYGMKGNDVIFGEGQDDDIIGGYGHDWISGGTGDDGVLGDDGRIYTSRNGIAEPLYGIGNLAGELDKHIKTPDKKQQATINVNGELKKTVNLTPFKLGDPDPQQADDIIFGGWGNDFLHGGDGDDAISGAEALTEYYGNPVNQGNVLKYGVHREGEFGAYNKNDPLSKVYWDPVTGEFVIGGTVEFLLNFDHTEGHQVNDVNTDGDDVIFGDLGNDWLVGGTGRDHMYGGRGSDLLNADDNLDTAGGTNTELDGSKTSYEDLAYGGAGPDVLIANIIGDRLIDWVGNFNRYVLPYTSFGANTISRNLKPKLFKFLYDLSRADGADQTLGDSGDSRNGEPNGELGLVMQKDPDWKDQQTSDGE